MGPSTDTLRLRALPSPKLRGPAPAVWLAEHLGVKSTTRSVRVHFSEVEPVEEYHTGLTASNRKMVPALTDLSPRKGGWQIRLAAALGVKPAWPAN